MIYDDYIAYTEEYQKKYGEKCVVFMQVGDFFEIYAVQNENERAGADIYKICDLCNIQVSRKNKSTLENNRQNPLMAGFPLQAIHKFIQILVQANYTIVLIRQVTPPPNPKREVTEIISPSTYMNTNEHNGNYLLTMVWEQHKGLSNVGIACIDITTGQSYVYEAYSKDDDPKYALDEAIRFIECYQPKEILIMGETFQKEVAMFFDTYQHISIHHEWGDAFEKMYYQKAYQNAILTKAFQPKTLISAIEWIGLEQMPLALATYCAMIQFTYEHNKDLVQKIELPTVWKNQKHLILESNSAQQLNVLSQSPNEMPLMGLLNRCMTSFGSRLFRERLLNPIVDIRKLNAIYDSIEYFQTNDLYKQVHYHLSSVVDLERILRKISMGTLQPCEWPMVDNSIHACMKVLEIMKRESDIESIQQYYTNHLNLNECEKYNLVDVHTSLFQRGIHKDVDTLNDVLEQDMNTIKEFANALSNLANGDATLCRVDYNDRDGYFLSITKKRWETILKVATKVNVLSKTILLNDCKVKAISSSSSNLRLTHSWLEELSDRIMSNQRKISNLNIKYYKEFLLKFDSNYHTLWMTFVKEIANIDVLATNAKNSLEYNYSRPVLIESNVSHLSAKGLRHPIIERLNHSTEYISNDIILGNNDGILLYGINASGKSSLMKAIGLNVIMAQAGMFVATSKMELSPYFHIFTRITSMDNIYRGYSTFTMEMLELKNILHRCDSHSLILGDELCSGTESISAISIVAAGIDYIIQRQANFVFATHLHELVEISILKEHPCIQVLHMHIEIDTASGKIIYDRHLKPGNGSKVYGLEVCRALNLPPTFIKMANTIRHEIQGESKYMVSPKLSHYNKELVVSECKLCGKPANETHHIQQQKDANEYGNIDTVYKDALYNLVVLCEDCHLKQHHGEEYIAKYIQTTDGVEVKLNKKAEESMNPKDYIRYTTKGWEYKMPKHKKWRPMTHKNYLECYMNLKNKVKWLPDRENVFHEISEEYQAEYLVMVL